MAINKDIPTGPGRDDDICGYRAPEAAHGFSRGQFIIMALGNIIGSGIFLASGTILDIAGRWTPLAYLLGGLIMSCQVSFTLEMTIATPARGSFKVHAQQIFGRWWGYTIGWMFWTSGVLGMASEVTACALFMRLWFPAWPLWSFSLLFAALITLINLNDVKGLSKIEFALASVKIAALVLFILTGLAILLGLPPGHPGAAAPPSGQPQPGLEGVPASMILVLFAYTGTGIMGLAAAETRQPAKTVPAAAAFVTFGITGLYTAAAALLVALLPAGAAGANTSPFVAILALLDVPHAADILNFILVTAALSSLNSQVYSASRMLLSLAENRQAPRLAAYRSRQGVPVAAVILSGLVLLATALLAYTLPEKLFLYTVSASGVLALVNWLSITATHYFYRRHLLANCPGKLRYKSPGYPYASWLIFALILLSLASAPLYPDQLPGLYAAAVILVLIAASYRLLPGARR